VYVALTVHLEHKGNPLSVLLNVVEVLNTCSGVNLAITFTVVLQTFEIEERCELTMETERMKDLSLM
jgi:hypothetical protein